MMKKLYFATICFLPLLLMVLFPLYFLGYLGTVEVSSSAFWVVAVYLWLGLLVVIVDLWLSSAPLERKAIWTVLNLAFSVIALPLYWFLFIRSPQS